MEQPLPNATADPLREARPLQAPTRQAAGVLAHYRDEVRAHLTTDIDLPAMLRQTGYQITFGQAVAWFAFVIRNHFNERNIDRNALRTVLAFLEYVVPTGVPVRAKNDRGNPPADAAGWIVACTETVDRAILDGGHAPTGFFATLYTARRAADDNAADALARSAEVRAMDAYVANFDPATRNTINLRNYLTALFNLMEAARPRAGGRMLIEAVITATISLSKGGNITSEKCEKIITAVQAENGIAMDLSPEGVQTIYNLLIGQLRRNNIDIAACLRNMATLFSFDDFMRVNLTITQSLGVGASAITLILQAIKAYPNHEIWAYLRQEAPTEMTAFINSSRIVARNQLIGLGTHTDTERIKGTLFPSVAFAAKQLLQIKGKMASVKRYRSSWVTPKAGTITNLINKVEETELDDLDLNDYRGANGYNWATDLADINFIADSLHV